MIAFLVAILGVLAAPAQSRAQSLQDWPLPPDFVPDSAPPPDMQLGGPIGFDEPEFPFGTVVNGLVLNTIDGVPLDGPLSFAFPTADARVVGGPGETQFVSDPSIEGDATDVLTIDFGTAVTNMSFGFVLRCFIVASPGVSVTALGADRAPLQSVSIDARDFGFGFSENELNLVSATPFYSVQIDFNDNDGVCVRFALDNLFYTTAPAAPTMGMSVLIGLAALLLLAGMWTLRRRQSTAARLQEPATR